MNRRLEWIDIAKAIAIFGTVGCHTFSAHPIMLGLSFSIFLTFWIVSGYTIKPCNGIHGIVNCTIKDFTRIIIPAFFVCLLSGVFATIASGYINVENLLTNLKQCAWFFVSPNPGMMWFFWTLLWAKLIYRILLKMGWLRYLVLVPLMVITVMFSPEHRLPLCVDVVGVALVYIEIGHLIRLYDNVCVSQKVAAIAVKCIGVVVLVISMLGGYYLTITRRLYIDPGARDYTYLAMIQCLCVMLLVVFASRLIEKISIKVPFEVIGEHTLGFLFLHFLDGYWLIPIVEKLFELIKFSNDFLLYGIRVAVLAIVTMICVKIQDRFYYFINHGKH